MERSKMDPVGPSKLSLFSLRLVIGAWWEVLDARDFFDGKKPEASLLNQQLIDEGIRREPVCSLAVRRSANLWTLVDLRIPAVLKLLF